MNQLVRSRELNRNPFAILNSDWDVFGPSSLFRGSARLADSLPAVDIKETETEYQVVADLPGVSKEDLELSVKDNILSIGASAEKNSEETDENEGRVIRRERFRGRFARTFKLGDAVDSENIQANYKDGVLSVIVPKKESTLSRKIEISVH